MNPRLVSLLAVLVLALPLLPAGDPASPAVCQAAGSGARVPPAAPTCNPDECAALCDPLPSRCRSGSCICFRDPA